MPSGPGIQNGSGIGVPGVIVIVSLSHARHVARCCNHDHILVNFIGHYWSVLLPIGSSTSGIPCRQLRTGRRRGCAATGTPRGLALTASWSTTTARAQRSMRSLGLLNDRTGRDITGSCSEASHLCQRPWRTSTVDYSAARKRERVVHACWTDTEIRENMTTVMATVVATVMATVMATFDRIFCSHLGSSLLARGFRCCRTGRHFLRRQLLVPAWY